MTTARHPVNGYALLQAPSGIIHALTPAEFDLLLTCAQIGLHSGPVTTPDQRALDAVLTTLKGPMA